MGNVRLLDCTLRDGAYVNDARFGFNSIKAIVDGLIEAGADIIECGWLKNDESDNDSSYFHVPSDLEKFSFEKLNSKLSIMVDYNRYNFDNINETNKCDKVDYIRITFPIDHHEEGMAVGEKAISKGFKICFQLTNAKSYLDKTLYDEKEFFEKLNKLNPACVCLADTFGTMFPKDVIELANFFDKYLNEHIELGLHTHNNMELAFANTIQFIEAAKQLERDVIVDSSILGMGRGAGNTITETLMFYLNTYHGKKYNIEKILEIIDSHMMKYYEKYFWGYSPYLAVAGMEGAHINNVTYLREKYNVMVSKLKKTLEGLDNELKPKYDYEILDKIYKGIK